ncbi:MAG: membrane protein insertase YidC [Spirochaetes bacterium]|nr:membrane protein insertase YidC [Spirochaetota bacterium]
MEKRTLLAILLTAIVWASLFWLMGPKQGVQDDQDSTVQTDTVQDDKSNDNKNENKNDKSAEPKKNWVSISKNIKEETVNLQTEKFAFTLSNKGALISKANYIERNIELTSNENQFNSNGYFDFSIHLSDDEFFQGNNLNSDNWKIEKADDKVVQFAISMIVDGNPIRIEKIYRFTDNGYEFTVDYRFTNTGKNPVKFKDSRIIFSPSDTLGPNLDYSKYYNLMTGFYSIDDSYSQNTKGSGFFSKAGDLKKEKGRVDYVGIMSRYFLLIMIPQNFIGTETIFDNREQGGFRTGMYVTMDELLPDMEQTKSFKIYLGEKDKKTLKAVDPKIVKASDVSMIIEPIRYFVIWCLLSINSIIGNLGWSLIIFSILTKIVFMPLTKKSTDSMKKMQEIAPQLKKLQAKYKDKPEVLQQETVKLYKEYKVNPLGGCLPLLLQMPFFFGLYSGLINSIDLWNAEFMLWIKDLSMPDTIYTISGFDINILPVLMIVTTIIQQKQTMVDTGNQQQKIMMYMMPVILLFVFWKMPSGLVLYWFLQNLYQIMHQFIVNKIGMSRKAIDNVSNKKS